MSLYNKIVTIYPELETFDFSTGVITLQNNSDGNGDFIAVWNHPTLTKPTQEQLDAITE
jgi:hypothetical protein